jgi:palmitoyltransferase ZDHHC1/11
MNSTSSTKRHNGLASPHSKMQISTWFVLPTLVVQFLFFISPILPLAASIVCTLVFFAACAAAALFGFMATAVDPIDPRISYAPDQGEKELFTGSFWKHMLKLPGIQVPQHSAGALVDNHEIDAKESGEHEDGTKYCWVCEHDVAEQSMHCRYCNKCIAKFDHHCQWLNTCVGERNYPFFFKTLWSIAILLVTHASIAIAVSIDILTGGSSKQRANDWFSANLWELVVAVNLFFALFDTICMILILQLLVFHIKLRARNLTTYKFILLDNATKRELKKEKATRKSQRLVAMGAAKRNGKPLLRFRLLVGGYLGRIHHCLDPLPPSENEPKEPAALQQAETTNVNGATGNENTNGTKEEDKIEEDIEMSLNEKTNVAEEHRENEDVDVVANQ